MTVFVLVKAFPMDVAGVFGTKLEGVNEVMATIALDASKVQAEMPVEGETKGMYNKFFRLVMVMEVSPMGTEMGKVTGRPLYCAPEIS